VDLAGQPISVANDPGCVKTHLSEGRSELLYCPLPAALASAIGLRVDEIEMEILRASSASGFSHSLDPQLGHLAAAGQRFICEVGDHSPGSPTRWRMSQ